MATMKIGELAKAADVSVDTIRYYERSGLMQKAHRKPSGYREYQPSDISRLRFIRRAKALGFSLDDIMELLKLNDGNGSRGAVRKIAQDRLSETDQKLREMTAISTTLRRLVGDCHGDGDLRHCPIIEAVLQTSKALVAPKRNAL